MPGFRYRSVVNAITRNSVEFAAKKHSLRCNGACTEQHGCCFSRFALMRMFVGIIKHRSKSASMVSPSFFLIFNSSSPSHSSRHFMAHVTLQNINGVILQFCVKEAWIMAEVKSELLRFLLGFLFNALYFSVRFFFPTLFRR